ncbi:MAG: Calx-beta domain-containing protein, partial [Pseudomonadota bacterium]
PPEPTVTIEASDPTGTEPFRGPVDRGAFLVKRTGDISTAITVNYSVGADSTATSAVDYQALSGSVVIPARRADALIYVVPLNDTTDEPDETVIVTLGTGTGYNLGTDLTATVTIVDNDETPVVTIEASDPTGAEPFRGPVDRGVFLIKRTPNNGLPLTVNYSVSGTAANGTDYAMLSGSVTIPGPWTQIAVNVVPLHDVEKEPEETVIVTLSAGAEYTLGPSVDATATIKDND